MINNAGVMPLSPLSELKVDERFGPRSAPRTGIVT